MAQFRFETLLKIRESERDSKKDEYLDAENRRLACAALLDSLRHELEALQNESRSSRVGAFNPQLIARNNDYREKVAAKYEETSRSLSSLTEETERLNQELNEAIKEVKVLENLKEREEERSLDESRRRHSKEMDEIAGRQKELERRRGGDDES